GGKNLAARSPEVDFAVVLSRVIKSIEDDPAQLRNAVYELARIKLRREAWRRNPPINLVEARRLTLALESAIERVETIYSKYDEQRALESLDRLIESSEIDAREVLIEPREPLLIVNQAPARTVDADHPPVFLTPAKGTSLNVERSLHLPGAAPLLRGAMVAIFAVALCVVLSQLGRFGDQAPQPSASTVQKNANPEPKPVVQGPGQAIQSPAAALPQSSPFPLPTVYGVYAVSGGQLHELEALAGRVPDQRVFMSTPIRAPSRTVLPDGKVIFIIYRRDVASSAPERVTVRVIAKIMRAMTFNTAGQASVGNVEDLWTIRNVSYGLRVAPLSEGSEMVMIRPENADFAFPAGRYGLVVKGQAYDFTVAGPITEASQCLEGIKASNGTFYSECRNP
ncbi:MAG TPA: hypothetical protein VNZ53_56105, partial [Steroidobacteraceae bacterium]|nr:hypothetical protein [Steroidobacteraceae bacterium]